MTINPLNHHYAMENPASVYDEAAMTALELAGRTTAKVNETVKAFNELWQETNEHLAQQDQSITKMNNETMPAKVEAEFQENLNNGTFESMVDQYAGNLENRLNNLLGKVVVGSTTMDAEVIDGRLATDGQTYPNLATAIRTMSKMAVSGRGMNIHSASQLVAPYDDVDNLPPNEIVIFSVAPKNAPGGGQGVCATFSYYHTNIFCSFQIFNDIWGRVYIRGRDSANVWQVWRGVTAHDEAYADLSMFPKIGVIGDSYASGQIYYSNTSKVNPNVSWPRMIARRKGIEATVFASPGLSTRSWLTDTNGLALLNSSDPCDLYILALGINDYYHLGESYIGAAADMHTKANTFYGNYAQIVEAVKAKAPSAKIVMLGVASTAETPKKFNTAIEEIASYYGAVYKAQTDDEFFTSEFYTRHMVEGHPTAVMYSGMSCAIERLLNKCMVQHNTYFSTP